MQSKESPLVQWLEIQSRLDDLTPVKGGNSDAQRGIVHIFDGSPVFVKIGYSEHTKNWTAKEIQAYGFLKEYGYAHMPQLLSANEDQTGFAIEALTTEDGWDWTDTWDKSRLDATLAAMDTLAALHPDDTYGELLKPVITDADNGWKKLSASPERQAVLSEKLRAHSAPDILADLSASVERSSAYTVRHDTLVHGDVRADNAAWNAKRGEVKLIDWNWLELGDIRLDLAAFLTHVHKNGLDVREEYGDRLDPDALYWIAGFWFEAASKPMWPGGPTTLRDVQLQSGLIALELSQELG